MGLRYESLDGRSRSFMADELAADIKAGRLYHSRRLSNAGWSAWPGLLREAFANFDDVWLAQQLIAGRHMVGPGRPNPRSHSSIEHETLAEGEFNHFYIRGVCLSALASDVDHVEVYRAKDVDDPRHTSLMRVGELVPANLLLDDLRTSERGREQLRIPGGANSGISVRLIVPAS